MFKVIESDITKSGRALSILNRDMALFVKNWNNTQGLKNRLQSAFTNPNVITQHDLTQINEYNKAISSGVSKQTAFYRCLGDSSIAVQNLAANARYGTINTKGLVVVTEELTLAQRASAVATQALVKGLNLIGNIAFAMAINAIITKVMELVNKEKELCDSAKESANEIKSQADEMKKLASEYEAIIDSEKSEAEKTEELNEWKQNLVETYGFEKDKLEELNTERERGIKLLKEEIDAVNQRERGIWLAENSTQFSTAKEKITNPSSSSNSRLLDGSVSSDIFTKINQNNIRDSIKNKFNSISTIGNSTFYNFNGENLIETYDNLQNLLSALGNAKNLSDDEKRLLSELKKEEKAIKKVLDDYQVIYETGYKYLAQNNFDDFAKDNPLDNVGKENYLSWRKGLLDTAQGDKELSSELESLIENQFPDLTKYFDNLDKAYGMFGIDDVINDANEGMKKAFINGLSDEDLDILVNKLVDPFKYGVEGAKKEIAKFKADPNNKISIETDTKSMEDMLKVVEDYSKSASTYSKSQKTISDALEEQAKYGKLASDTVIELTDAGYASALVYDDETGAITLNRQAVENLNTQKQLELKLDLIKEKSEIEQKYKDKTTAIADMQREMATANETRREEIRLSIAQKSANASEYREMIAQYDGLLNAIGKYNPSATGTSAEPSSVTQFKKDLAEKEHLLNTNQITEQEYYEWLDDESKRVYGNLKDYEEDLWKYEEQVYKWRQEQEQDLFDKKIENYKKLSDNALDKYVDGEGNELTVNASFNYAREQIYSAIEETQNRINELSLKTGFEDEIDELKSDLEDLYDTLEDINKKEIESQKDYISRLKDEYSDLMDEQIDQQKKLADSIDEAYEKQIDIIDKQIDAIEKANEAEERQNDIIKARQELEKASVKNRMVYTGNGRWEARRDEEAYQEAKENYDKELRDEQIAKLKEQKELLESQRNNSKDYYDKVIEDLENQKTAREKQYDILVDIYEQLGGEKQQTSLNNSLIEKLTKNGDINKAVQNLTPSEMKQAIESGLLTVDSDGNYAIDYEKVLNKSSDNIEEIKNNTTKLADVINNIIPDTKDNSSETTKPINNTINTLKPLAGYNNNIKDIINDVISGKISISSIANIANTMMDNNIQRNIQRDINDSSYFVNNNNISPTFNITNNFEGSPDDNAVNRFTNKLEKELSVYTQKLTSEFTKAITNQRYSHS